MPVAAEAPAWAGELALAYESGAHGEFILYGNVHDRLALGDRLVNLEGYLRDELLSGFRVVFSYDLGNGLLVERESGEVMWRALNNSAWLGNSYLAETNPKAFGLYQRGRDFESYQDAGAHYERRPSIRVEPLGQWGQGMVRLIEIPAKLEADDNIVAYWIPAEPALAPVPATELPPAQRPAGPQSKGTQEPAPAQPE